LAGRHDDDSDILSLAAGEHRFHEEAGVTKPFKIGLTMAGLAPNARLPRVSAGCNGVTAPEGEAEGGGDGRKRERSYPGSNP
jgi:hypothetical protein